MPEWIILHYLVEAVLMHRKGCVVEIGIGNSTKVLARHAERSGVNFYTCDLNKDCPKFTNQHSHFHGSSFEFIKIFDDIPAVVFLDGNHNYEIVSVEVKFFLEKLIEGGIIFLHDTYPPTEKHLNHKNCSDSYRLRQEYEKKRNIVDCFTWPYTAKNCGLTMILKKDINRPFYRE